MLTLPPFDVPDPDFDTFRALLLAGGLEIQDDERHFGYISFYFNDLYAGFTRNGHCYAHVPLGYCDDLDLRDRSAFDQQYAGFRDEIRALHGEPIEEGQHRYAHRPPEHRYRYAVWQLQHCRLALLQNEYDIQFGLDLSLRYLYRDGEARQLLFD